MTFPQPILVFGPRKSGTSLLHNLLDGGSELVMIPGELKLHPLRIIKEEASCDPARHYLHYGRLDFERLIEWHNEKPQANPEYAFDGLSVEQTRETFDVERYVAQLSEMLDAPPNQESDEALARDLVDRDVAAFLSSVKQPPANLKFWASKEVSKKPEITIPFWRRLYLKSRIVYLVRQPEFIVRSILNNRRRKGIRVSRRMIWSHCIEAQHFINFAYEASHWPRDERPIFLSYEEMTAAPEKTMQRVAQNLGLTFEPILARPTTLGVPMIVRTSSRATTEVFRQEASWQKGLTRREILIIQTFRSLSPLVFRRQRETLVPYATMQARIEEMARE